jgi:hypothetical protein
MRLSPVCNSPRKAAAIQKRLLLGRSDSAEHGVAVREVAEARMISA